MIPKELRSINVSDMISLILLSEGLSQVNVSRKVGISQPSIARKMKKIEAAFGITCGYGEKAAWRLTDDGAALAKTMKPLIEALVDCDLSDKKADIEIKAEMRERLTELLYMLDHT